MKNDQKTINVYIIRHGEASKSWEQDPDPGLNERGKSQSEKVAQKMVDELFEKEFKVISSPLKRAQQTAIPLKKEFGSEIEIDEAFGEIPSPGVPLIRRKTWLRSMFNKNVSDFDKAQKDWRNDIINAISKLQENTVIFSHFTVINCVAGWLENKPLLVSFYPDNCSITKIELNENGIDLVTKGAELKTIV